MEISITINDALAVNALSSLVELGKIAASSQREQIKSTADTQQFGLQTSGLQSLLTFIGTLITANLQEKAEKASSGIMPMLLGMMMGNNGFPPAKKDSPSADISKIEDDSKTTPSNPENSEE